MTGVMTSHIIFSKIKNSSVFVKMAGTVKTKIHEHQFVIYLCLSISTHLIFQYC